jgi:quercetin dioxygenase-like cupin family protein
MRRFGVLLSLVVLLFGVLALHAQRVVIAQEATPGAEAMTPQEATEELLILAPGIDTALRSDLLVFRFSFKPGTVSPIDASPGVGILLVESGRLTAKVDGVVMVTRGAGRSEAMATAETIGDLGGVMEAVSAGEAITLETGDAAYIPGNVPGEIRNESPESATAMAFIIAPSEVMTEEATPAP